MSIKIKFEDPIAVGKYSNLDPYNFDKVDEHPGVYIYGVKKGFIDDNDEHKEKFIPVYVGQAKNLRKRLEEHYHQKRINGNSPKELFDIASKTKLSEYRALYNNMGVYDKNKKNQTIQISIPDLIWFNAPTFFDTYFNLPNASKYKGVAMSGHLTSISKDGDLDEIKKKNPISSVLINSLQELICENKKLYNEQFYFIYYQLNIDDFYGNLNVLLLSLSKLAEKIKSNKTKEKNEERKNLLKEIKKSIKGIESLKNKESELRDLKAKIEKTEAEVKTINKIEKRILERIELSSKIALQKIMLCTTAKADGFFVPMSINIEIIENYLINIGGHVFGDPYKNLEISVNFPLE